jgi:beta-glucanase (GH16 family)
MKKNLKNLAKFLMLLVLATGCQEDDKTFGDITAPTNLDFTYEIVGKDIGHPNGDGSGNVNLHAKADNAITYKFTFSDETVSPAEPLGEYTKQFTDTGVHTYVITAIAYGSGGASTSKSVSVTVFSNFSDPVAIQKLTGGSSKVWYWAAATPGHLGVGPNDTSENNAVPFYYAAAAFEKAGSPDSSCLYDNKLTFSKDGNALKYTLDNGGKTFFNAAFNDVGGSGSTSDQCSPFDTSGVKNVSLAPSTSLVPSDKKTGTVMNFSDGGFMGYYIGTSSYEILSITDTEMHVRAVMGGNESLAWYHIFTTQNPNDPGTNEPDYTNLVWSDEFDVDGAPNPANWSYDLGGGGWGNGEQQFYTEDNVIVDGGFLKITAKAENEGGLNYTSSRIKTEGKFDFTYGKVEIRAKLAGGSGTWPALWMLGANYQTATWPACGEIDIMEHVGNTPGQIHGTLHFPGNSGGNGVTGSTTINDATDAFHIYSLTWSATKIRFYVDGNVYHSFDNTASTPFNADFFLIFNIAMGGNFGGEIAPGFVSSTMEVDYVKVYQ